MSPLCKLLPSLECSEAATGSEVGLPCCLPVHTHITSPLDRPTPTGSLKDIRPRLDKTVLLWGLEIGAEELPARLWRQVDL